MRFGSVFFNSYLLAFFPCRENVQCTCIRPKDKDGIIKIFHLIKSDFYLQINKLLQQWSRYKLSSTKIAGSIGKKTTIVSSDVDMIIFLPPDVNGPLNSHNLDKFLSDVLEDFEWVLRNYNILFPIKDIRHTAYSLNFNVRNFQFDLLPAIDFMGNSSNLLLQQQMTLDIMPENLRSNVYRFSPSLAFSTVDFMKKQSSFAHDMARLAKFWYKSASIATHVSGASYFMELVAVHVVHKMSSNKHSDAFVNFLQQIINFENIDIVFLDEYRLLNGHRPTDVMLPRLMDPVNPYNNLGRHFTTKSQVIPALKAHARNTYQNLRNLISMPDLQLYHSIDLFDPLLMNGVKVIKFSPKYNPRGIRRFKDVDIRHKMNDVDRKKIQFIQLCLSAVCKKLEERYGPNNLEIVIEALVKILTAKLKAVTRMATDKYRHDEYDATVLLQTKESGAIRCSFDFDNNNASECDVKAKLRSNKQFYSQKSKAALNMMDAQNVAHCYHVFVL